MGSILTFKIKHGLDLQPMLAMLVEVVSKADAVNIGRDLNAAINILRLGMESLTVYSQEAHSL